MMESSPESSKEHRSRFKRLRQGGAQPRYRESSTESLDFEDDDDITSKATEVQKRKGKEPVEQSSG